MNKYEQARKNVEIVSHENIEWQYENELYDFITSCEETEKKYDVLQEKHLQLVKDVKRFNQLTVIKNYKYGNGLTISDSIEFTKLKYKLSKVGDED